MDLEYNLRHGVKHLTVLLKKFGERAVLKLLFVSLLRASARWRRLVISEFDLRQLEQLRKGSRSGVPAADEQVRITRIPSANFKGWTGLDLRCLISNSLISKKQAHGWLASPKHTVSRRASIARE